MAVYLADVAQGTTSANRNHAYALEQAESERKYAAGVAEADSKLYLEQKKAEAALIVGQADAQGPADIAYAEAVRDRDNRYAEDTYIWIDAVASASVDYATEQFDFIEYTNLVRQADQVRADADEQAREIYQQDVDAAGVQVPLAIGGFKTAYVQSTGDAQVTHTSEVGAAAHAYADESAAHDQTLTVQLAQVDETHQRELLAADYTHTLWLGPQDKLFAERLRDAGVARAGGRATSEAQYQFTLATQTAAGWASLYAGSNSDQHEFQAAESAALAEWIEQLAPAFVAFAAASAQADGQLDVDLAAADATQANAEALAAKVYGNTLAAQERIRSIDLGAIANAGSVVAVDHDNAVAVDVAEANLQQALQHVAAENAYAVAADAIPRQFRANPTSAAAWQAGKDAVAERDKAFAQADFDWRLDASQAEFDFAVAEAVREEGELKAEALVEKTYSQALADAEHTQSVSLAQAERTHMIAATNAENASRGTSASANAAYLTASHAQKTAALDVLVTQLAGSLWSNFERDRAAAEASAWQTVAPSYLSWQSGVSAAYSAYTLARADAYQTSAIQIAGFVKDHARAVAQSTYTEVVQLAGIERDFGNQLANSTAQYRLEAADVEFTYATDTAEMIRTNNPGQYWTDYTRTQAMIVVNREYRERYVTLDKARHVGFAQAGYQLVSDQAGFATSTAQLIATSQQSFDAAAADAYYTGNPSTPGLEDTLALAAYNYDVSYSTTFNTALDDLATTTATPWAEYAAAESAAEHTIVTLPLALVTKTNRLNLAAAENTHDLALGAAGRQQWLAELSAEANHAKMDAAKTLAAQSTASGNPDLVTSPTNLTLPTPDTGTVTLVANNYLIMHPGAISQYWLDRYFDARWFQYPGYLPMFTWAWQGETYGYYWDDRGTPFQGSTDYEDYGGIGYSGFAADYVQPPNPYWGIAWTTDFHYAYGYWNYHPGLYTWHGWNPAYAGAISGASSNTTIEPKADIEGSKQIIDAMRAIIGRSADQLQANKDQTPTTIGAGRGIILDGSGEPFLGPLGGTNGSDINLEPVSLDEWSDRLTIASGGDISPGLVRNSSAIAKRTIKTVLMRMPPPDDNTHAFTGLGDALATSTGEFVRNVTDGIGILTNAFQAASESKAFTELSGTAHGIWEAMRIKLAKQLGLKWQAYHDLLVEYKGRVQRDKEIYDGMSGELFATQKVFDAGQALNRDRSILAILKLGIQELEAQYHNLGLDSVRVHWLSSGENQQVSEGIAEVGLAALHEKDEIQGLEPTGIEFDVALVGPALINLSKLGFRAAAGVLLRQAAKTGTREAVELVIINREFVPIAERILQNLTNQVSERLIANRSLALTVLSKAEVEASAASRHVAIKTYGKAVERLVAQEVKDDTVLRTLFKHVGTENGSVDFIGEGIFKGHGFDITTNNPATMMKHLERAFNGELHVITYKRPVTFP